MSVGRRRKHHSHGRSTSGWTFNINPATRLFDNAATDSQPQNRSLAFRFGGKETGDGR
jgi:hypothetical protein